MTASRGGPCRAYVVGEHARALRRRVLLAAVIAFVVALALPPLLRAAIITMAPYATFLADVIDVVGFAAVYLLVLWLAVGPRRLVAMQILIWGSRYAAAGYAAVTGIRDPADATAAAAWLSEHPPAADEGLETRYWRAYAHLVAGDPVEARSLLTSLIGVADYGYAVAALQAQIALAEGTEPDLDAVAAAAEVWADPLARAVAMANLGALRAQRAFVCGDDDVAAVLTVRPAVDRRPARFFLFRVWLPLAAITLAALAIGRLVAQG